MNNNEDLGTSVWDDTLPKDEEDITRPFQSQSLHQSIVPLGNEFSSFSINDPFSTYESRNYGDEDEDEEEEEERSSKNGYDALKDQEIELRKELKQQLLDNLTQGSEDTENNTTFKETTSSPKITSKDSLFNDSQNSPIKIDPSTNTTNASPTKVNLKNKFKSRLRKYSSRTNVQHMKSDSFGPLSKEIKDELENDQELENECKSNYVESIVQEANGPLYDLKKENSYQSSPSKVSPKKSTGQIDPDSNKLEITVGDPMKVGDITNAHIVYKIKTRNKNPTSKHFPSQLEDVEVTRRYKDFRWLYHQLQNNHPGRIIPPPPSKQTYIGRFNENFIEHRQISLERMLTKIAQKKHLQNDEDFVRFLTDQDANLSTENSEATNEKIGGATSGFLSLFTTKQEEEVDDFFVEKKEYVDNLESNLKQLLRSVELIIVQKHDIIANMSDINTVLLELDNHVLHIFNQFAQTQVKVTEILQRSISQEEINMVLLINNYIQILHSIQSSLNKRKSMYQKIQHDQSQPHMSNYQAQFDNISKIIKEELQEFELERIDDFRNSVEIFVESSIENQKEAIELYESFLERSEL